MSNIFTVKPGFCFNLYSIITTHIHTQIYIQRTSGCDHMLCSRCKTDFCYKCGDQLRQVKFFGDHYSRLSILGCRYRYKPENPVQRRLVRGTLFASRLVLIPPAAALAATAGVILLGVGIAALPLYGGVKVYRRMLRLQRRRRRRRLQMEQWQDQQEHLLSPASMDL